MASILYLIIRYSFNYIKPKKLVINQQHSIKFIISQILDELL